MKENAREGHGKFPNLSRRQFLGGQRGRCARPLPRQEWPREGGAEDPVSDGRRGMRSASGYPHGAAPASQQYMVSVLQLGRGQLQGDGLLRDRLLAGSSRRPVQPQPGPHHPGLHHRPGGGHPLGADLPYDVGVLHPAGDHVERRQRGDGQRLRRDVPLLGRPQARLGLHLLLVWRDQELHRGRGGQGARQLASACAWAKTSTPSSSPPRARSPSSRSPCSTRCPFRPRAWPSTATGCTTSTRLPASRRGRMP